MKRAIIFLAILVLALAGCQQATETAETNTNEGEKPAEDLKTTLSKIENGAFEAWKKKDGKHFEGFLADGFVGNGAEGPMDREATLKSITENPCEVKSYKISDEKVTELGDSAAIMTSKAESDFTCKAGDKEFKGPSPVHAASLYVKDGDTWRAAYHQTLVASGVEFDPPPRVGSGNGAEKKEAPEPDEMTKTLAELDKKFWEAWTKKDAKVFEDGLASNFSEINPNGVSDRAATIKSISEHNCEITKSSFSDPKSVKISDSLYIFMIKGSMEGKCGDQNAPATMNGTTIFSKDGEDWKPVFHMATPGA